MAKFEVFEGVDAKIYFRLRADNGEIVAQSEGYASRENARRGVSRLVLLASSGLPIVDSVT